MKERGEAEAKVKRILWHFERFVNDLGLYAEDEVLYGISGYLFCLLMILKHFDSSY